MQIRLSTRQRLLPIVVLALCLIWAGGYVFEAASDPFGGDEAALFIQPIFYLLIAAGLWAAVEALLAPDQVSPDQVSPDQVSNESGSSADSAADDHAAFGATGLADRRRLTLVLSLPVMAIATGVLGFVLSAPAYVVALSWALNERRWSFLALLAFLAIATVWLFFKTLLGVPLPLWPSLIG